MSVGESMLAQPNAGLLDVHRERPGVHRPTGRREPRDDGPGDAGVGLVGHAGGMVPDSITDPPHYWILRITRLVESSTNRELLGKCQVRPKGPLSWAMTPTPSA